MKKLVLLLAVVFSVSLFSCGGSNKAAEEATDSVAVVEETVAVVETVDSVPADSVAADSAAVEAPATAE